ncbi:MAG: TIGR02453 family protein [Sandaracinus sp.]|nr:TIGR02453 family protein [Sandaracinus sp.]|tara:strand:+ start:476 stop:1198 length:723 start_codon:yes stop_codon:yes gene_type:complete
MSRAKAKKATDEGTDFEKLGPGCRRFLKELAEHNERAWFKANQDRYEALVREPARAFVRAMEPVLADLSEHLVADDRKVGGSIMRVHRDTRFGKDKTPYKTNLGIQFRHEDGKDVHAPGCYLHVAPDECFLGMGMWRPDAKSLRAIREKITAEPERWEAIVGAIEAAGWRRGGESLKRAPKGFDADHPLIEELRRKDHILVRDLTVAEATGPGLVERCRDHFATGREHMRFLCEAVGVAF